jgi:hypothetical protein
MDVLEITDSTRLELGEGIYKRAKETCFACYRALPTENARRRWCKKHSKYRYVGNFKVCKNFDKRLSLNPNNTKTDDRLIYEENAKCQTL